MPHVIPGTGVSGCFQWNVRSPLQSITKESAGRFVGKGVKFMFHAVRGGPVRKPSPGALLVVSLLPCLGGCGDLLGSGGPGGPLTLTGMEPLAGEVGVSVLDSVRLDFSRPLDPSQLGAAMDLWDGDRRIRVSVQPANRNRVLVLIPSDPLDFGTVYRVEPSGALTFRTGAALPQAGPLEFTTEGRPPPVPDSDSLLVHLEALAHDSMRGRNSGSVDEMKAAEYLKALFMAYGLQEAPGGAIQAFEAYSRRLDSILTSQNVLAVVEGSGALAQDWVVVGAHYDHIGFRNLGSEEDGPNNGADDNGSGTVLLLEMARVFKAYAETGGMEARDRRSVLFAAFGAEEQGLLGSCAYVHESPAVPLARTRAMMNFDMVGRLRDNTLFVSGGETSYSWTPLVLNSNHSELTLAISDSSCTGCTDHACFWQAGIPFVGLFTGLHDEYHGPGDDVNLINLSGMVRIGNLAMRILSRLTVMPEGPRFQQAYPS